MKKLFSSKSGIYLFVALITGVILLLISGSSLFKSDTVTSTSSEEEFEICEERCEERVKELVSSLSGVSNVKVLLTLDEIPKSGEQPNVRGVAIVCKGCENSDVKLKIIMLVSTALGISSDKIFVTAL